ncbi:MAG TPA: tetratricopeptide repeat protein [Gammaproteobacteria bacterium]|nr:tetratricopeptide repeat protein [Gammaproteobacteria bacterium]
MILRLAVIPFLLVLAGACAARAPVADGAAVPPLPPEAELRYRLLASEVAAVRASPVEAAEHAMRAAELASDPPVAARALELALAAHNDMLALAAARRWQALAPQDESAIRHLAVLELRSGSIETAFGHFAALLETASPGGERDERARALVAMLLEEPVRERAADLLMRLAEAHPDDAELQYGVALAAARAARREQALAAAERTLALDPHRGDAHLLRARILLGLGRRDEALDGMARRLTGSPEDTQLRLGYAHLLAEAGEYARARGEFEEVLRRLPQQPEALFALGLLALDEGRLEEARARFLELLRTGLHTDDALYFLGVTEERDGDVGEALEWYRRTGNGPRFLDAQGRIAGLLMSRTNLTAGREYLARMRTARPELTRDLYLVEARLLMARDQHVLARHALDALLAALPADLESRYLRGVLAAQMGDVAQAERDLRAVIDARPDDAEALNALGYTLADATNRHLEAYGLIRRALTLAPDNPAIIDSMGWVMYRLGNHAQAIDYLRRALALQNDPEIAAHLGEVLWVSGAREEARLVWEAALRDFPDDKTLHATVSRFTR